MNDHSVKERNFTPIIVLLTIVINALVAFLYFMPKYNTLSDVDLTILPFLNAVFNSFTFVFLVAALVSIKQKNIKLHKRFILAAFTTTALF
ncbi:putative membrane protein [Schinkia azotoformans MEV2011]|uniref:Putative membrane protein n=2 Tax=Schinkia azotoformans TaxID=1454 RepID=A0A072NS73_SCHAZ|nr:putative membrane protein [Schinkia azotoformans MEV2011]